MLLTVAIKTPNTLLTFIHRGRRENTILILQHTDCISYFQIHLTITVANDYIYIYAYNFNKFNTHESTCLVDQTAHEVGTSCIVNEPTVYAVLVSILGF